MPQPRVYNTTMSDHILSPAELHEMAINFVEEYYPRKGEVPFLWLLDLGHEILWMETPWEDEAEQAACLKIMRIIMRELQVRSYCNIVEAWASTGTAPSATSIEDALDEAIPPSQRPKDQRDDIVLLSTWNRTGDLIMTRYLVTLRRHGPNFLGPRQDMDTEFDSYAGRMTHMLENPACPACGISLGHKAGCLAPLVVRMFTAGRG